MKALKIVGAIVLAPVFVLVIDFISATFRHRVPLGDDIDWVIAALVTVVLYWAFFTGRLAWVFRKV